MTRPILTRAGERWLAVLGGEHRPPVLAERLGAELLDREGDDVLEANRPGRQVQLAERLPLELTVAQDVQMWLGDPAMALGMPVVGEQLAAGMLQRRCRCSRTSPFRKVPV